MYTESFENFIKSQCRNRNFEKSVHKYMMSIVLFFQNFTLIFWTVIVVLNLYVALLLYRLSSLYRDERISKLEATESLKENLNILRIDYEQSRQSTSGSHASTRHNLKMATVTTTTAATNNKKKNKNSRNNDTIALSRYQQKLNNVIELSPALRKSPRSRLSHQHLRCDVPDSTLKHVTCSSYLSSSSSIPTNRSDDSRNNPIAGEELHTLYISDSYGRVVHEIPFRECDYVEALRSVLKENAVLPTSRDT